MKPPRIKATLAAALLLTGAFHGTVRADEQFEHVKILLERNLADKDVEVKVEATGGKAGLASLKVVAPDGRTVIDFKAPDSKLGIRHLSLESPEPPNDGRVQADFPAGTYAFSGSSTSGQRLEGKAMLSHAFPEAAVLVRPRPDASDVPVRGLKIDWQPVKGLDALVVVIEQESSGREVRARLAGNATSFAVPEGFLLPDTEYKLAIGTVAKSGNSSFIETTFTTVKK